MPTATFIHRPTRAEIDGFEIDVSIQETHHHRAQVTRHPVEEGLDPTDSVQVQPDTLEVEWMVSDHPIGREDAIQNLPVDAQGAAAQGDVTAALNSPAIPGRYREAYAQLLSIFRERRPVTVVTALSEYEDMVIEDMRVPRDAETQSALLVTLRLTQIRIVETDEASLDPALLIAEPESDQGRREPREPDAEKAQKVEEERGSIIEREGVRQGVL